MQPPAETLASLETPRLILDVERLERNARLMQEHCAKLRVTLRPHLKTSKSLDIARLATGGGPITVSTLKEAEYFAHAGYRDILYATAVVPNKLIHADRIQRETGARLMCVVDTVTMAETIARAAESLTTSLRFLIEIDCGEHRSGTLPDSPDLLLIAAAIAGSKNLSFSGVLTHAGHSYAYKDIEALRRIAEDERRAAVDAATRLRAGGFSCPVVSVGSTPTVLFADHLEGVTEARCGIYLFWDLAQFSREVCRWNDMAVSVLASVIGHNVQGHSIIQDAGALALSKDLGANAYLPDVHYGYVCDPETLERYGTLSVDVVHQEHGIVQVPDESWFARLPVGSLVRVLPNHACLTCAAYDSYEVTRGYTVVDRWHRVNGW